MIEFTSAQWDEFMQAISMLVLLAMCFSFVLGTLVHWAVCRHLDKHHSKENEFPC